MTQAPVDNQVKLGDIPLSVLERDTPKLLTAAELRRTYYNPDSPSNADLSFFGKVRAAFGNETVVGQLYRNMGDPDYIEDPDFEVTDDLMKKYGSDLLPETQERIKTGKNLFGSTPPRNFVQFLHEINDARHTERTRRRLFEGGALDFVGGLAATVIASIPEFAIATAGATTLGSFVSTPAGGAAAGTATAVNRFRRIGQIIDTGIKSQRGRVVAKTLLTAAAVDVPMEVTRYYTDKTMRPIDFAIGVSAAGAVGGGVAAFKPQWFSAEMRAALRETTEELEEEIAAETASVIAGKPLGTALGIERRARARRLERLRELRLSIKREIDRNNQFLDRLGAEGGDEALEQIKNTADALGIPFERFKSAKEFFDEAQAKITRDIEALKGMQSRAKLESLALDYGISPTVAKGVAKRAPDGSVIRFPPKPMQQLRRELERAMRQRLAEDPPFPAGRYQDRSRSEIIKELKRAGAKRVVENRLRESRATIRTSSLEANNNQIRQQVSRNLKGDDISELKGKAGKLGVYNKDEFGKLKAGKGKGKKAKSLESVQKDYLKSLIIEAEVSRLGKLRNNKALWDLEIDDDILNPLGAAKRGKADDISPEMQERIRKRAEKRKPADRDREAAEARSEISEEAIDDIIEQTARNVSNLDDRGTRGFFAKLIDGEWGEGWHVAKWWHILTTPVAIRLRKTDSPILKTASMLFFESTATGGYNMVANTKRLQQQMLFPLHTAREDALVAARKAGTKLDEEVALNVHRSGVGLDEIADEHIRIYVAGIRKFNKMARELGVKNGVLPKELPDTPGYFHRIWQPAKLARFIGPNVEVDVANAVKYFRGAIIAADSGMAQVIRTVDGKEIDKATAAAKRIVSYMRDPVAHGNFKRNNAWIKSNAEKLKQELGEGSEEIIDDIMNLVSDGLHDPVVGAGRPRIKLDENFVGTGDMGNFSGVKLSEFTNNNLFEVSSVYAQRLTGAGELRKSFLAFVRMHPEAFSDATVTNARNGVVPSMDEMEAVIQKASIGTDAEGMAGSAFRMSARAVAGLPMWDNSSQQTMKHLLRVQALGQSTIGQYLGLAQLPEISNIIHRSSLRAALISMPSLGEIRSIFLMGLKNGDNLDPVGRQLGTAFATGFDHHFGDTVLRRLDEMNIDGTVRERGAVDRFLDAGRTFSMLHPLGIIPMDTFLRRWSTKANFQWFVDNAYKMGKEGKVEFRSNFWRDSKRRFRELGLTEDMVERINKQLTNQDVVQVQPNWYGSKKVIGLALEKFDDQGAFDALALAMRRQADSMVQRQSIGDLPYWMQMNPFMRLISQFRVFSYASKGKQLAAGMTRLDGTEVSNIVGSAALGYLSYLGLTYARLPSIDPRERRAWFEERTSFENIVKSGIYRSSYANIFPQIIDAGALALGSSDPVFNKYVRTSDSYGLNPLNGSVGYGVIMNTLGASQSVLQNIVDPKNPWSKKDLRNVQRAIWLTKIPIIDQILNEMISQSNLPATDRSF